MESSIGRNWAEVAIDRREMHKHMLETYSAIQHEELSVNPMRVLETRLRKLALALVPSNLHGSRREALAST